MIIVRVKRTSAKEDIMPAENCKRLEAIDWDKDKSELVWLKRFKDLEEAINSLSKEPTKREDMELIVTKVEGDKTYDYTIEIYDAHREY